VSVDASRAVWAARIVPPTRKLVALALAECLNGETGQLNPSLQTLADMAGITRGQAQRYVRDLIADGLVSVTANRFGGRPGTTPSYRMHLERFAEPGSTGGADAAPTDGIGATPTDGTEATPTDSTRATPGNETGGVGAEDGWHTRRGGVAYTPQTGSTHATQTRRNQKGTGSEPARAKAPPLACPVDVDRKVWTDWCALRLGKRAKVSETALSGARDEAAKAGLSLEQFLRIWCLRGSQGLEASWLKPTERAGAVSTKHSGFDTRNHHKGVSDDGVLRI